MKLGLITDIHEQVELLRSALDRFDKERVDQVIVIGDMFELGKRIEETCRLLAEANAIGVWGNHDYGLCVDPNEEIYEKYPAAVIEYMTSLRPRLDVDGCHLVVGPGLRDIAIIDVHPDEVLRLDGGHVADCEETAGRAAACLSGHIDSEGGKHAGNHENRHADDV